MGAGSSAVARFEEKTITDIIIKVIISDAQESSINSYQTQEISLKNVSGVVLSGINFVQVADVQSRAIKDSKSFADLKNEIIDKVTAKISANLSNLGIANRSESDVRRITKTAVDEEIRMESIQKCLAMVKQMQRLSLENVTSSIVEDVSLDQSMKVFIECLQKNENVAKAGSKIEKELGLEAGASVTNPIADIFTGLFSGPFGYAIIILVIGVAAFVLMNPEMVADMLP